MTIHLVKPIAPKEPQFPESLNLPISARDTDLCLESLSLPTAEPVCVHSIRHVRSTRESFWHKDGYIIYFIRRKSKDNLINHDPQCFLTARDIQCGSSFDHPVNSFKVAVREWYTKWLQWTFSRFKYCFFALLNLVPNSAFEKQQQQQKRLALIKGLLIDAP